MPCRDPFDDPIYRDCQRCPVKQSRLDDATRAACEALGVLEKRFGGLDDLSDDTLAWWTHHKEADAARLEAETRRQVEEEMRRAEAARVAEVQQAALAKLTDDERAALGLEHR